MNLSDAIGLEIERRDRRNFEMQDGRLMVCHGHHDKGHHCEYEPVTEELIEEYRGRIGEQQARIEALEEKWSLVFDGYSVLQGLTKEQKLFVSPEAVSAVLDSVARLALIQEPTK